MKKALNLKKKEKKEVPHQIHNVSEIKKEKIFKRKESL